MSLDPWGGSEGGREGLALTLDQLQVAVSIDNFKS